MSGYDERGGNAFMDNIRRKSRFSSADDDLDEASELQKRIASLHRSLADSATKLTVASVVANNGAAGSSSGGAAASSSSASSILARLSESRPDQIAISGGGAGSRPGSASSSPMGKYNNAPSPRSRDARMADLERERSQLLSERESLLHDKESARKECELLAIQKATLETQMEVTTKRAADLEERLEQLKLEQAQADQVLEKARRRKTDLSAAMEETQRLFIEKKALEQELVSQKQFQLRFESALNSLSKAQSSVETIQTRLHEETGQLRGKLQREKDKVLAAEAQVELLRAENSALHEAIEHLRVTMTPRKARPVAIQNVASYIARSAVEDNIRQQKDQDSEDEFYGDSLEEYDNKERNKKANTGKSFKKNQVVPIMDAEDGSLAVKVESMGQQGQGPASPRKGDSGPTVAVGIPVASGDGGNGEGGRDSDSLGLGVFRPGQSIKLDLPPVSLLSRPSTKRLLINMFLHMGFLALMILVVLNTRDFAHGYFISSSLRTLLQNDAWNGMQSHADVANWLRNTVVANLYPYTDYNGNRFEDPQDAGYLLGRSRVLGSIRLRQSRAKKVSCGLPKTNFPNMQDVDIKCIKEYSLFSEDTESFGPPGNPEKFVFTKSDYIGGIAYLGTKATYGVGGFVIDLPSDNSTAALAVLNDALSNSYLDRQTSALFLEFSTFTPAVQLFVVWRYAMEFPREGGVITYPSITVVNLFKYAASGDSLTMLIEGLILAYIIKMGVENFRKWKALGKGYFSNFFNLLDFISLVIFFIVIVLRLKAVSTANSMVIDPLPNYFFNLSSVAFTLEQETNAFAFNGMLCFMKLFYYFRIFPRLSMLSRTMAKAGKEVSGFMVIFFIILLGFSQTFYVSMGKYLGGFKDFTSSISSLFQMILGAFTYDDLANVNRVLAPLLFSAWNVLAVLVLLNMFVAIISEAFVRVQADIRKKSKEKGVGEELVQIVSDRLNKLLGKLQSRKKAVENMRTAVAGEHGVDADKFAALRAKLGTELSKYDLNKDNQLDEYEIEQMLNQLTAEEREIAIKERILEKEMEARAALAADEEEEDDFPPELRRQIESIPSVVDSVQRLEASIRDISLKEERIAQTVSALNAAANNKAAKKRK